MLDDEGFLVWLVLAPFIITIFTMVIVLLFRWRHHDG